MAKKKTAAAKPEAEQPEVETEAPAPEGAPEPVVEVPTVEPKATYTDEEQAAYFGANLTADQDNIKPYADIHDWYRRTGGLKKEI